VVFPDPRLVVAELIEPLDQFEVAAQREARVLAGRMERRDEDSEAHARDERSGQVELLFGSASGPQRSRNAAQHRTLAAPLHRCCARVADPGHCAPPNRDRGPRTNRKPGTSPRSSFDDRPTRSPRLNLFVANADTRRYLPRPATEEALVLLEQRVVVERAEATLLVGPPGIGKSMLLRVLAQRLRRTLRSVTLGAGDIDAPTFCSFVLDQLHRDASEDPEQAILLLAADFSAKRSALVIAIDAAERLPLATAGRLGALAMTAGGGLRIVAAAPEPRRPRAHSAATGHRSRCAHR
jgi:ATPase subunit of ABC transporter with duplicated ATPase domains